MTSASSTGTPTSPALKLVNVHVVDEETARRRAAAHHRAALRRVDAALARAEGELRALTNAGNDADAAGLRLVAAEVRAQLERLDASIARVEGGEKKKEAAAKGTAVRAGEAATTPVPASPPPPARAADAPCAGGSPIAFGRAVPVAPADAPSWHLRTRLRELLAEERAVAAQLHAREAALAAAAQADPAKAGAYRALAQRVEELKAERRGLVREQDSSYARYRTAFAELVVPQRTRSAARATHVQHQRTREKQRQQPSVGGRGTSATGTRRVRKSPRRELEGRFTVSYYAACPISTRRGAARMRKRAADHASHGRGLRVAVHAAPGGAVLEVAEEGEDQDGPAASEAPRRGSGHGSAGGAARDDDEMDDDDVDDAARVGSKKPNGDAEGMGGVRRLQGGGVDDGGGDGRAPATTASLRITSLMVHVPAKIRPRGGPARTPTPPARAVAAESGMHATPLLASSSGGSYRGSGAGGGTPPLFTASYFLEACGGAASTTPRAYAGTGADADNAGYADTALAGGDAPPVGNAEGGGGVGEDGTRSVNDESCSDIEREGEADIDPAADVGDGGEDRAGRSPGDGDGDGECDVERGPLGVDDGAAGSDHVHTDTHAHATANGVPSCVGDEVPAITPGELMAVSLGASEAVVPASSVPSPPPERAGARTAAAPPPPPPPPPEYNAPLLLVNGCAWLPLPSHRPVVERLFASLRPVLQVARVATNLLDMRACRAAVLAADTAAGGRAVVPPQRPTPTSAPARPRTTPPPSDARRHRSPPCFSSHGSTPYAAPVHLTPPMLLPAPQGGAVAARDSGSGGSSAGGHWSPADPAHAPSAPPASHRSPRPPPPAAVGAVFRSLSDVRAELSGVRGAGGGGSGFVASSPRPVGATATARRPHTAAATGACRAGRPGVDVLMHAGFHMSGVELAAALRPARAKPLPPLPVQRAVRVRVLGEY